LRFYGCRRVMVLRREYPVRHGIRAAVGGAKGPGQAGLRGGRVKIREEQSPAAAKHPRALAHCRGQGGAHVIQFFRTVGDEPHYVVIARLVRDDPCGSICDSVPSGWGVEMAEVAIRLHIEPLEEGGYVATSPDVPGLVAEGRSITEAAEIAQGLARKIAESCLEHGDPLPPALANFSTGTTDLLIPVAVS